MSDEDTRREAYLFMLGFVLKLLQSGAWGLSMSGEPEFTIRLNHADGEALMHLAGEATQEDLMKVVEMFTRKEPPR